MVRHNANNRSQNRDLCTRIDALCDGNMSGAEIRYHADCLTPFFAIRQLTADGSNQTFFQHDDSLLLDGRMHSEHNTNCCIVRDKHPTNES